jgi:hypothetical protein
MGAEPYYYVVPYQTDVGAALQALRRREFEAGRYNPLMPFPSSHFPLSPDPRRPAASTAPSRRRSRLRTQTAPCDATPDTTLVRWCGTPRPTRAQVEADLQFLEDVERGHAVYLVLDDGTTPSEILFAGYSFD